MKKTFLMCPKFILKNLPGKTEVERVAKLVLCEIYDRNQPDHPACGGPISYSWLGIEIGGWSAKTVQRSISLLIHDWKLVELVYRTPVGNVYRPVYGPGRELMIATCKSGIADPSGWSGRARKSGLARSKTLVRQANILDGISDVISDVASSRPDPSGPDEAKDSLNLVPKDGEDDWPFSAVLEGPEEDGSPDSSESRLDGTGRDDPGVNDRIEDPRSHGDDGDDKTMSKAEGDREGDSPSDLLDDIEKIFGGATRSPERL